jgi:hypothetical protein
MLSGTPSASEREKEGTMHLKTMRWGLRGLLLVGAALATGWLIVAEPHGTDGSLLSVVRATDNATPQRLEASHGNLTSRPLRRVSMRKLIEQEGGLTRAPQGGPRPEGMHFLPAVADRAQYEAAKNATGGGAQGLLGPFSTLFRRPGFARGPRDLAPADQPAPQAPPSLTGGCEGVDNVTAGPFFPPDTHGAMGPDHFVEITNSHIDIYARAPGCPKIGSASLNGFFSYEAEFLFDPRVLYDATFGRWVIYAEAFPESNTTQLIFIAASATSDPLGLFFPHALTANIFGNDFWDFGQVGFDHDAIIITANIFKLVSANPLNVDGFKDNRWYLIPKHELYAGLQFGFVFFFNFGTGFGTISPPIVQDRNPISYLYASPAPNNFLFQLGLRDSARVFPTITFTAVPVPFYTFPSNIRQPGSSFELDSSDARFVNMGTQIGNSAFQVHTVDFFGFPTPRWYQINTATSSLVQSGSFFASGTSNDWNASITANFLGDVFVTWSSTDVFGRGGGGLNAQVRVSGRNVGDPAGVIGPGTAEFTSPVAYQNFRWGDYSAVTLDPRNFRQAWAVNEKINTPTIWGSRIVNFGY